jgi:hypothetical protein
MICDCELFEVFVSDAAGDVSALIRKKSDINPILIAPFAPVL